MSILITVGMPVFNGENYLESAIESVLGQTFESFELIIADNSSTDRSMEVIEKFASRDNRIRVLTSDCNRGAAWNFNRIVGVARGEFFQWLAADDFLHPDHLSECHKALTSADAAVLAYPAATLVREDGTPIRVIGSSHAYGSGPTPQARFRSVTRKDTYCTEIFGLIRCQALQSTRLIGSFTASDVVLIAELSLLGEFLYLERALFFHRMHARRSVQEYPDKKTRIQWFDSAKRRSRFPVWKVLWELLRAAPAIGLPAWQRWRCFMVAALWAYAHKRELIFDAATGLPGPQARFANTTRIRRRLKAGSSGVRR